MIYKIVADSSCDFYTMEGVDFASAALTIITDERQFRDDPNLDLDEMLDYLSAYKGRSGTSCPNVGDWLEASSPHTQASPAALAKSVLAEVPRQLVEYYSHKELPPRDLGAHA